MRVLLALLAALLLVPAAASAPARPRVGMVGSNPLVVRGWSFRAGERVTVTVAHGKAFLRRVVVAGPRGGFVARWQRALPTTCASTFVLAVGSKGSRAVWKMVANDCAQPKTPDETWPTDPQPKPR